MKKIICAIVLFLITKSNCWDFYIQNSTPVTAKVDLSVVEYEYTNDLTRKEGTSAVKILKKESIKVGPWKTIIYNVPEGSTVYKSILGGEHLIGVTKPMSKPGSHIHINRVSMWSENYGVGVAHPSFDEYAKKAEWHDDVMDRPKGLFITFNVENVSQSAFREIGNVYYYQVAY